MKFRRAMFGVSRTSRVSGSKAVSPMRRIRLWCDRLPCGRIVATRPDGTMLLCIWNHRHLGPCFHPELRRAA